MSDDTPKNGAPVLSVSDILAHVGFAEEEIAPLLQKDQATVLLACCLRLSFRVNRMEEYLAAKAAKRLERGGLWVPPGTEN